MRGLAHTLDETTLIDGQSYGLADQLLKDGFQIWKLVWSWDLLASALCR